MKKLSVIVINYNAKDFLRDCIKNIDGKYENLEMIVIDNSSPDGSFEMLENEFSKEQFPWLQYYKEENNGLAVSSNVALEKVSGDYILYLGSDAFPDEGTLPGLINFMEQNQDVGIATAELYLRDNSIDLDAHRGFPTPWAAITYFTKLAEIFPRSKILNQYFMGYADMNKPHEIDMCISHFMLIRKDVFESVGRWDEDFFLYGEDVDFCYRVKQNGWKIMYVPQFRALHIKGVGVGIRKTSSDVTTTSAEEKLKMQRISAESMKIFYKKHYSTIYPKLLTAFVLLAINIMLKFRVTKQLLINRING